MSTMNFRLLAIVAIVAYTSAAKLPQSFKKCKVSPDLDNKPNDCLKVAIEDSLRRLSDGDKELGVYHLDPLKIQGLTIEQGGQSPVAIKLTFMNTDLIGIKNAQIKKVAGKLSSPTDFNMELEVFTPALQLIGDYEVDGRVLVLPIRGSGKTNLTLENIKVKYGISASSNVKNNKEYLKVNDIRLSLEPGRMYIFLENLFNGDKALGDNMNRFLNENWKEIFGELKGSVEKAFVEVIGAYTKRILERVQFKNIFLLD